MQRLGLRHSAYLHFLQFLAYLPSRASHIRFLCVVPGSPSIAAAEMARFGACYRNSCFGSQPRQTCRNTTATAAASFEGISRFHDGKIVAALAWRLREYANMASAIYSEVGSAMSIHQNFRLREQSCHQCSGDGRHSSNFLPARRFPIRVHFIPRVDSNSLRNGRTKIRSVTAYGSYQAAATRIPTFRAIAFRRVYHHMRARFSIQHDGNKAGEWQWQPACNGAARCWCCYSETGTLFRVKRPL
eukprot:284815339_3